MTRFGSDDQLRDRTRATWNPAREIAYGFGRRPRGERAVQQHEPATPPHEVAQKRPVAPTTAGTPCPIASRRGSPKPSYRLGNASTDADAYKAASVGSSTWPR